jgi:hypothetical protein
MTVTRLLLVDAALLASMILSSRAAVAVHEFGGHALPARAAGASRLTVRVSPLGGGYVRPEFPPGRRPSPAAAAVFKLGGIALNLATGALAWLAARRLRSRGLAYLGLFTFGFGSVAGGLVYLTNGFYYGSGDPLGFVPRTQDLGPFQPVWALFVAPAAGASWLAARHFLDFLSGQVPLGSTRARLGWTLATAGLAAAAYGGLWALFHDPSVEGTTSEWRLQREIARETARRAAVAAPPAGEAGPAPAPPAPVVVRPEEVKHRVPPPVGPFVLLGVSAAAVVGSLVRARPAGPSAPLPAVPVAGLAAAAALAVAGFRWLG